VLRARPALAVLDFYYLAPSSRAALNPGLLATLSASAGSVARS
jgi:hypothetical protein